MKPNHRKSTPAEKAAAREAQEGSCETTGQKEQAVRQQQESFRSSEIARSLALQAEITGCPQDRRWAICHQLLAADNYALARQMATGSAA